MTSWEPIVEWRNYCRKLDGALSPCDACLLHTECRNAMDALLLMQNKISALENAEEGEKWKK
jgi:hypothetical protein